MGELLDALIVHIEKYDGQCGGGMRLMTEEEIEKEQEDELFRLDE